MSEDEMFLTSFTAEWTRIRRLYPLDIFLDPLIDRSTFSRDSEIWGSLQYASMGNINIFAYNSQNSGKIETSLVWSSSSYITS